MTDGVAKLNHVHESYFIKDAKELEAIKTIIKNYLHGTKKDYKYKINVDYTNHIELAEEFVTKALPILMYAIVKLEERNESGKDILIEYLNKVDYKTITSYYLKYNSGLGNSLVKMKLDMIIDENETEMKNILILLNSLLPGRDRPIKPDTVGVPEQEFESLDTS